MTVSTPVSWPDPIEQARLKTQARRALELDGRLVGSVAEAHLHALSRWPEWVSIDAHRVVLHVAGESLTRALNFMNQALRDQGLIVAWRDEIFPLLDPTTGKALATFERAAARFWGALTLGAHCNGYVADTRGQPVAMWVARRSLTKPTDPGKRDNLIGGGVPHGQSPLEAVIREGWEEAGLRPQDMQGLQTGGVLELDRDVPEGRQWERLHVFDLALSDQIVPRNQDGEVADLALVPVAEAVALALSGEMTVDAALVTLEFALRHSLTPTELAHSGSSPDWHWRERLIALRR